MVEEAFIRRGRQDGFTAHAALYVLVMIALIVVNFSFLTGSWSSAILLVAWGIVLALHYLYLRRMERAEADRGPGRSSRPPDAQAEAPAGVPEGDDG